MIKDLLEYQNKERDKLALCDAIEGGKAKRELDDANRTIGNAKIMLLNLENDAKSLLVNYESVSKSLKENLEKISAYNNKKSKTDICNEVEAAAELSFVSELLAKISAAESQLNDIAAKINAKTNAFEDAKTQVVKAQKIATMASGLYQNEVKAVSPKIEKIDAELKAKAAGVNSVLLEKYKQIRKSKPKGDIVVKLNGNRCGGCHFELPLSLIHTVSNQGYIICEECGKIIYK